MYFFKHLKMFVGLGQFLHDIIITIYLETKRMILFMNFLLMILKQID